MMASYDFEEDAVDGSGNGRDGVLLGGPVFVEGVEGMALLFDGEDDCIDLGLDPVYNFPGSFSVSVWVNITEWTTFWGNVIVGNRGDKDAADNNVGWQFRQFRDHGNLVFSTRGIETDADYSPYDGKNWPTDMPSVSVVPTGEWIHIAVVLDTENAQKSIYLNGTLDAQGNFIDPDATLVAAAHNVYVGARANADNSGPESFFDGAIDKVLIYDGALSADEILVLAQE
jgi:hypothetical protein